MSLPVPRFVEVGPRDGLQNEARRVPPAAKVAFIEALAEAGPAEIEAGAFVKPAAVPQMADTEEVFRRLRRRRGVLYSALVPNAAGLDRALAARADKIAVFTAASETFNRRNINSGIRAALARLGPVVARALQARLRVRGYLSTAFHCPYEGPVKPARAVAAADGLLELGVEEISIGDTIGRASPPEVRRLLDLLLKRVPASRVFLHFHDTYGMAVANALTAWHEYGISGFDSSAGGLGGCPYAPGASGNVATEDLAFALRASGAKIGLDIPKLIAAALGVARHLDHPLRSRLSQRIDRR